MSKKKDVRQKHKNFIAYQKFIVEHENYNGLYFTRNADDAIRWVVTGKSADGLRRREWWIAQCQRWGINVEAGAFAKVAVLIHPTKLHTCQICGKSLLVEYRYPNAVLIKKIKTIFGEEIKPFEDDIFEIIDKLAILDSQNIAKLRVLFKREDKSDDLEGLKEWINS